MRAEERLHLWPCFGAGWTEDVPWSAQLLRRLFQGWRCVALKGAVALQQSPGPSAERQPKEGLRKGAGMVQSCWGFCCLKDEPSTRP